MLHYDREQDTLACLRSLAQVPDLSFRTLVVDNGSTRPIRAEHLPGFAQTEVLALDRNLGFAGGMNAGIRHALPRDPEYVLLLNNDTTVAPTALRELTHAASQRPDAGIVSPLVLDQSDPDLILSAGWEFDPRRGHPGQPLRAGTRATPQLDAICEVDASSGEAMLISRAMIEQVGLLDERLFLRLEDIDLSLRMRAAGRRNYVALGARIWHRGSASSGEHSALNAYYHTRNMLVVCARHEQLGQPRSTLRELETVLANLAHARRGHHPLHNVAAALAGWRDAKRGRLGPRTQ